MFKILAGDIPKDASLTTFFGTAMINWDFGDHTLDLKGNIQSIEIITEENKKGFIGAAGWGLVGTVALGPIGLLAGILKGGNKKEIAFAVHLKDGRKFMALSDAKTYQKIQAASF